jgi:hypothetical protein
VHVDARDFSYYDLRRLIFLYAKIESGLFAIVARSRQQSSYCTPCGARYADAIRGTLNPSINKQKVFAGVYADNPGKFFNKQSLAHDKYNSARYAALNLHSWFLRGTIECRMHHGTIRAGKIQNWGILWARILDYAFKAREKDIHALPNPATPDESFTALFNIVADLPELQAWLIQRARKFGQVTFQTLNSLENKNVTTREVC